MAAPLGRAALDTARAQLAASREAQVDAMFALDAANRALAQAQRTGTPTDVTNAQAQVKAKQAALDTARSNESKARDALLAAITAWLKDDAGTHPVLSPADDVGRLSAENPIVLFPVRLETRFDPPNAPTALKVRIYPDEIFLNTHEKALTPQERDAGIAFHDGLTVGKEEDEPAFRQRWRNLVQELGSARAAYVARTMTPTPAVPPATGQVFPQVKLRADHWTRPGDAVLPDRWVVIATRGTNSRVVVGTPIREPLNMTPDPTHAESERIDLGNQFSVEKELAWTVDFAQALTAGMAVQIPLATTDEKASGFDRLVVIGVKTSLDAGPTAVFLEDLLDSHHYTRGLGLVPQGTPTNNTTGRPVPFPFDDPTGDRSFDVERRPPPRPGMPPNLDVSDGPRDFDELSFAFGLTNGVLANTENASVADDMFHVSFMHQALWPVTLGYYIPQILRPLVTGAPPTFDPLTMTRIHDFFVTQVSARGAFPAFRIGSVPYGVLPALSLDRWAPRFGPDESFEDLEQKMLGTLLVLRQLWAATAAIPRLQPQSTDPYDPLVRLLAEEASTKAVQVRSGHGPITQHHKGKLAGVEASQHLNAMRATARAVAKRIGQPSWLPRGFAFEWAREAHDFDGALVSKELSDRKLDPNYLVLLENAKLEELRQDTLLPDKEKPLLYLLLRHALILEYQRIAPLAVNPLPKRVPLFDIEYWFGHAHPSDLQKFTPLFELLNTTFHDPKGGPDRTVFAAVQSHSEMRSYLTTLHVLSGRSTEQLQRLFSEGLDVCSHRLDAWLGAYAIDRLTVMRNRQLGDASTDQRAGSYLGGYGWLENVRPRTHTIQDRGGAIGQVEIQADNGGFIHAPSQAHASAAALLRAGRLTGRLDGDSKYAIDLSSERARRARQLIQEVRNGQPLGALLGYQIERGISDSGVAALQPTLHLLRKRFPLVANKGGGDPFTELDAVAARSVVDGNLLLTAYKDGALKFDTDPDLPKPNTAAFTALKKELDRLGETMDAVADLAYAEAVYQVVQADVASAQANLDFLPHGRNPPEPELTRAEGRAIGVTQRVAVLFTKAPGEAPNWPAPGSTARAAADPLLDAWAGLLLGDPKPITATVSFKDGQGAAKKSALVKLSDLQLRPLDVVALAQASPGPNQGSILDRRILAQAALPADATAITISYDSGSGRPGSLPEVLEVARTLGAMLASSRALSREDLRVPDEGASAGEPPVTDASNIRARAAALLTKVNSVITDLGKPAPRPALVAAAQLLPTVFPARGASEQELIGQAQAAAAELDRRLSAAGELPPDPAADPSAVPSEVIGQSRAVLQAILGEDFIGLAGMGPPPSVDEVNKSLGARSTLLAGDEATLDRFLQQTARVREGVARWRRLALYARALGRPKARTDVVQLPHNAGETWIGASVPAGSGRLSLVLVSPEVSTAPPTSGAGLSWSGLFVDEWVETVPRAERETGVGFHYDYPNAEAPQAVLMAVPSATGAAWSWDDLVATLNETLDLTHIRTVEPRHLPLGQALPAIYLGSNPQSYTASTSFLERLLQSRVKRSA